MKGSISIGKLFGIKVLIHYTFFLIFGWVAFIGYRQGLPLERVLGECLLVAAAFVCVVLHEFGHALTARRFGIQTRQILLLPIGGVAQLQRIPHKPMQELAIALAGPLVNLLIISALLPVIALKYSLSAVFDPNAIQHSALISLVWANVILVAFNLIPAFPMDGGRVLRALLSMKLEHKTATLIAARIGQVLALGFAAVGIYASNYLLVVVGAFVFIGAEFEYRIARRKHTVSGFHVKDAMLSEYDIMHPLETLEQAQARQLANHGKDFLVVEDNLVIGILTKGLIAMYIKDKNFGPSAYVGTVMLTNFPRLNPWQTLDYALMMMKNNKVGVLPVIENNRWIGAINMDNVVELAMLRTGNGARILAE